MPEYHASELPRERLQSLGADALSDRELVAILLRTGIKGKPVLKMAAELLAAFNGSLLGLCAASVEELRRFPGLGKTKSLELYAAFALARRLARKRLETRPHMNNPQLIADFMREIFHSAQQEEFHVLLLDPHLRVIREELITLGLVDRSLVHAREVFRCAIKEACTSIVLCHNHPSGDPMPSPQDIEVTRKMTEAGAIIGISVLDHIIVSGKVGNGHDYFSFREQSLMP
ncbi:MAG: DNA repair protein RadC [Lentisphaeria bacterium]|nr:DNA repair protein RadC [Lentisphaeria bacterium]